MNYATRRKIGGIKKGMEGEALRQGHNRVTSMSDQSGYKKTRREKRRPGKYCREGVWFEITNEGWIIFNDKWVR